MWTPLDSTTKPWVQATATAVAMHPECMPTDGMGTAGIGILGSTPTPSFREMEFSMTHSAGHFTHPDWPGARLSTGAATTCTGTGISVQAIGHRSQPAMEPGTLGMRT